MTEYLVELLQSDLSWRIPRRGRHSTFPRGNSGLNLTESYNSVLGDAFQLFPDELFLRSDFISKLQLGCIVVGLTVT